MLCTDTSGSSLSFTVVENTDRKLKELYSQTFPAQGRMNEAFFGCLDGFFAKASQKGRTVAAKNIAEWVCITGPGSFTGIRIGLAALSGITLGLGKKLAGLSSLDAAALISGRDRVRVAARLRMNEYAVKSYDFSTGGYSAVELQELYPPDGDTVFINGKINTKGYECLSKAIIDPRVFDFIGSASPVYVKKSEAEINFDKKSAGI